MGWFKRLKDGIQTATRNKKEVPDGIWHKCSSCKNTYTYKEFKDNYYTCIECGNHERIGSREYFEILYGEEENSYEILFDNLVSKDILHFEDTKKYTDRLKAAYEKTGLNSAISIARGNLDEDTSLVTACMDFKFIGGSMGSVVGEKICRAAELAIQERIPLLIISKSGGARMQESAFSLMQMAKTSAVLGRLARERIPYISLMTDPTTGGVTASYSMLGDFNIAEPNALIGFAGPRVIMDTIKKKELPEGFQRAESLLENGFLDFIVERKELKGRLISLLSYFSLTLPEASEA